MSDLFRLLLLALRLSAKKSEIKKETLICPLACVDEYKKVVYPKKYLEKKYQILDPDFG